MRFWMCPTSSSRLVSRKLSRQARNFPERHRTAGRKERAERDGSPIKRRVEIFWKVGFHLSLAPKSSDKKERAPIPWRGRNGRRCAVPFSLDVKRRWGKILRLFFTLS